MNNYFNYNTPNCPVNVDIYPNLPGPSVQPDASNFVVQNPVFQINDPVIDTWLLKKGKYPISPVTLPAPKLITISSAKLSLKLCSNVLNKLTIISNDMQANIDKMSPAEWKKKIVKIGSLKEKFNSLITAFNSEAMACLKKSVKDRNRKRKNNKKKAIRKVKEKQEAEQQNLKIHKEIDQWLEAMKEENIKAKTEENMNKDIDVVLHEVNKKKSDARRHISLLTSLIKLRNARESMRVNRGEKVSAEDKRSFVAASEKMLEMWENALKNYTTEEHMLKTMLEKSASDNLKHKQVLKIKSIISSWEKVIFGGKTTIPPNNMIYWALTAAERDIETFIAIRKSWDTFLVPNDSKLGSRIPIGWVLPPSSINDLWVQYLSP